MNQMKVVSVQYFDLYCQEWEEYLCWNVFSLGSYLEGDKADF